MIKNYRGFLEQGSDQAQILDIYPVLLQPVIQRRAKLPESRGVCVLPSLLV